MERLSASTAPGGGGPEAYAAVLADDFSRWTVGSDAIDDKAAWVQGVREWFEAGWRVADRETRHLEIVVRSDLAFAPRGGLLTWEATPQTVARRGRVSSPILPQVRPVELAAPFVRSRPRD